MKNKCTERTRHVVAWLNKAEWNQVLEYLYSKDCALQKYALQRISAWKGRYAHSTPVAVECTADLVRCQVLDKSGKLDGDDLVLIYGTALVRFVNLITERQQGKVARPLRLLAGRLNIPEWIVNLRHDITHRKLPTVNWCQRGCEVVLEWLQQEYWSRQLGGGLNDNWNCQSDPEDEDEELRRNEDEFAVRQKDIEYHKRARGLLISFEKEQYQALDQLLDDKQKCICPAPSADMSWTLAQIKHFALESSEMLIDVLLDDGFLVPTIEQLQSLKCNPPEDANFTAPQLPLVFLNFWLPLLKMLNSPSFIHLLLEKLFVDLQGFSKESNNLRIFYLSAWISEVVLCNIKRSECHFQSKEARITRKEDKLFVNRIQLRWQQLLTACLEAPCCSTPHLLQLILDDMEHPLPFETRQKLLQLCTIYAQRRHAKSSHTLHQREQPIYTLDSLNEKLQHCRPQSHTRHNRTDSERSEVFHEAIGDAQAENASLLRGSPWQVCTEKIIWKQYPLGKVPGQSEDPSCLMIDNYFTMTVFDQPVEVEITTPHTDPGVSAQLRTTNGFLWTNNVNKMKAGLQLF